jgi:hypothetical protein
LLGGPFAKVRDGKVGKVQRDAGINGVVLNDYKSWWDGAIRGDVGLAYLSEPREFDFDRSKAWEPFVVVRRFEADSAPAGNNLTDVLPRVPEAYVGRYRNKVAWTEELLAHRYNFYMSYPNFITHLPHKVR